MTTTDEKETAIARKEDGRLEIPPFTPAAVCDAISRAAAAVEVRRADINLGVLQRRGYPATHPSIVELQARKQEALSIDLEAVDFRAGAELDAPSAEAMAKVAACVGR